MIKLKKKITLALVCLLTLASNAQNKFATLSGEIKNYDNQSFLIDNKSLGLSMDTVNVISGKFSASIMIDYPCVKHIDIGRFYKPLFLVPGKLLILNFIKKIWQTQIELSATTQCILSFNILNLSG